jgi:glutathione peroxidase
MRSLLVAAAIACGLIAILGCDREEDDSLAQEGAEVPEAAVGAREVAGSPQPAQIYGFELKDIGGQDMSLAEYSGRVLLLVNVASRCGYTKQYAGLQALNAKYAEQGLVVMGFPANNFGGQEPGTNEEIRQFCTANFGVSFPMFAKISVKGDDIHPLYQYLTDSASNPGFGGPISWNFTKFLVARDGRILGRYAPNVEPLSDQLVVDVEAALAAGAGS